MSVTDSHNNKNDELVVQWLLETEASLTLTPMQKELKMNKETIILANLAVDFSPLSDSLQDVHQKRFEQLQQYYNQAADKKEMSSISSSSKNVLQLSSRMGIENETERTKLKMQVHTLLERLATRAAQELYNELLLEEQQKQRRILKRRKKKRNKRNAKINPGSSEDIADIVVPTTTMLLLVDETKQQEPQEEPQLEPEQEPHEDTSSLEDTAMPGEHIASPVLPPAVPTREMSQQPTLVFDIGVEDSKEESKEDAFMCDEGNGSFLFDSYIDITDDEDDDDDDFVVIPLGSAPNKKTSGDMSYVQALGVTPEVSKVMQTQRKEHLEMMQQVQLKAFIAETQATAARERIDILEQLLHQVLTTSSSNVDANLKRTIKTTLATASDC